MSKAKIEKPTKSTYKPPVLKHLGALNGKWKIKGSIKGEPDTEIKGWESYEWMKGGFFMIMRWKLVTKQKKHKEVSRGMMIVGLEDGKKICSGRAYDNNGNTDDYQVSLYKGAFSIKGNAYRFEGALSKDRRKIEGVCKQRADSGKWVYQYDKKLKKVKE